MVSAAFLVFFQASGVSGQWMPKERPHSPTTVEKME